MRIAMLSDCYLPRLGGIEVQVHDLTARLVEAGHEVEVFTLTDGADGQRAGVVERVDGVPVHRLGRLRLPRGLLFNPAAVLQLRPRLAGFDVAHVHMGVVSPFATDAAFLTTHLGLPTAMTWHCVLHRTEPAIRAAGVVRRWAAGGMAMSAVSTVAAEPLRRIIASPSVAVLPNGIDAPAWRPTARPARDPGIVRLISAMRLESRKRPVALVEAVAKVRARARGVDVRLEILGEGADRGKVEAAVARVGGGGWVSLPGRVPRESLPRRYAAADVYVSPSVLESFGIAALEARTAGLPVVSRLGSGVAEFVQEGVNGYLAADDDELVTRLVRLATDSPLLERMTAFNLATAPAQDWPHVLLLAEAEYARALARPAAVR